GPEAKLPYFAGRFTDDGLAHFGLSLGALGENDGYLYEPEALAPRPVLHLDLKRVPVGLYPVQRDRFQHAPVIAFEACRYVEHRHLRNEARVDAGSIRNDEADERPVHDPDAVNVAGSDSEVRFTAAHGLDQAG